MNYLLVWDSIRLVFSLFQLDFWVFIAAGDGSRRDKVLFVSLAVVSCILFPIFLPFAYIILSIDDMLTQREINIFVLSKVEIFKLQFKYWFQPPFLTEFWEDYPRFSNRGLAVAFLFTIMYLTAIILFPIFYLFFISTQKHFAKKELIRELRS